MTLIKWLLVLVALVTACSSEGPSDYATPAGWENIGTLEQPMIRKVVDAATPANGTYDFNSANQLDWAGPFWISISAWVQVDDPAAGALTFEMSYADPTSQTRFADFGGASLNLVLSDPTSFFTTFPTTVVRESGSSFWQLETILAGSAGTSEYHYELMLHQHEAGNLQPFDD